MLKIKRSVLGLVLMFIIPLPGFGQTDLKHSLTELLKLLEQNKGKEDYITYANALSNFYAYNKIGNKQNLDSAIYYANLAIGLSKAFPQSRTYGRSLLSLARAKLKLSEPGYVLHNINAILPQTKVQLLTETGAYYLYKPGEEKSDLDSAFLLLNSAVKLSTNYNLKFMGNAARVYLADIIEERMDHVHSKLSFIALIDKCLKEGDFENAAAASSRLGDHLELGEEKLSYYHKASSYFQQSGNKEAYVGMEKAIADVQINMGQLDAGEKALSRVLQLYKKMGYKNLQFTYDLLSSANLFQGKLKNALTNCILAIEYMEQTGSDASKGYFLGNLGNIYAELGNTKESVKAFQGSLEAMEYQNSDVKLSSLKSLSDQLIRQHHLKEVLSLSNLYAAKQLRPVSKVLLATIRGNTYNAMKDYKKALKFYLEMIHWESVMPRNFFHSAESFYTIAAFYTQQRDYHNASIYFNKVLALPRGSFPISKISNTYLYLYKADSARNDLTSALNHYKRYKAINDSLLTAKGNRNMQEMLVRYQAEQKEKDNELLRKENTLQVVSRQKAEWIAKVTAISLIAFAAIIGLLFYSYRSRKKANQQLLSHQKEIMMKNDTLENLIRRQSKLLTEKEWLIKEIHHRTKNNLQVITSLLNAQTSFLSDKSALAALKDSQNRIQSISLIHQKLFQTEHVASVNMKDYITELMKFLCDTFHVNQKIRFNFDLAEIELNVIQAIPLGLIINEGITNIIKYAFPENQVGSVTIELQEEDTLNYRLMIADDGIGLPPDVDFSGNKSLGFTLMSGLGGQIGGSLQIQSEAGVRIRLSFPKVLPDED
ncbi:sensory transduction histidine kinase [Pedobacter sp. BAL39]|uniref:sensor histidine kinase n=1 Tax=Pedobacter sp. BAL39 TaxID=391596 RepID=UPI0001559572|nr:sensor histidine kinase [Pedobacter sp. BAL39]EDM35208.1 sensory transduction histidine kinase [Pedobacter sp. BAL39]